jgi:biofilm protein TabA
MAYPRPLWKPVYLRFHCVKYTTAFMDCHFERNPKPRFFGADAILAHMTPWPTALDPPEKKDYALAQVSQEVALMILDKLTNIETYRGINGNMDLAIDFIIRNNTEALPLGRHPIHGNNAFVTIMATELGHNDTWEKHRKYIDIQIALAQGESIAWTPADCILDFAPYDEAKGDIQLSPDTREGLVCPIPQGWFAIYFPSDAHRPGIGQGSTRKAVVKVAVQ